MARYLSPADAAVLTGKQFFPQLISDPFHHGLVIVFTVAALLSLIGALASLARGRRYVHDDLVAAAAQPRRGDVGTVSAATSTD